MTELRAPRGYAIIERIQGPTRTLGGLYIPETVRDGKPRGMTDFRGKVVSVGEPGTIVYRSGKRQQDIYADADVEVGDTVLYSWQHTIKDGKLDRVRLSDIAAVDYRTDAEAWQ